MTVVMTDCHLMRTVLCLRDLSAVARTALARKVECGLIACLTTLAPVESRDSAEEVE